MNDLAKIALTIAKKIQEEVPKFPIPPSEGLPSPSEMVFPHSLVKNTRGYIERIAHQINGSYARGWYDACAVMIRRLIETLIIEVFEAHNIEHKIKDPQTGDFLYLKDLIKNTLSETIWNLTREAKRALPHLKDIGDKSAHSRRFTAHKEDIDKLSNDVRLVVEELKYLANFE